MSLKEYKEIDNDGFVVDSHVLDDTIKKIPENYRESWGYDKSFYTPKWNFAKESWEEFASKNEMLKDLKDVKKSELSQACQNAILGYFKAEIDGVEYEFSYDREAQQNLSERWQLFQNGVIESIVLTGHVGDEDVRLEVGKPTFDKIYIESVKHKENCIKRLRDDLYPLVDMSQSEEDLKSITWDMEILTPTPESIVVRDDKLLNDEVKRLEMESAQSGSELMGLIMMLGMGF